MRAEEEGEGEGGGVRSEWEGEVKMASEVVKTATEPSPRLLSLSLHNTFVLSLPFLLSHFSFLLLCFPFAESSNG